MTTAPDDLIHVRDDAGRNLCGEPGESVSLDEARDPDDDLHFTCGACWKALSGDVEPMGGAQP